MKCFFLLLFLIPSFLNFSIEKIKKGENGPKKSRIIPLIDGHDEPIYLKDIFNINDKNTKTAENNKNGGNLKNSKILKNDENLNFGGKIKNGGILHNDEISKNGAEKNFGGEKNNGGEIKNDEKINYGAKNKNGGEINNGANLNNDDILETGGSFNFKGNNNKGADLKNGGVLKNLNNPLNLKNSENLKKINNFEFNRDSLPDLVPSSIPDFISDSKILPQDFPNDNHRIDNPLKLPEISRIDDFVKIFDHSRKLNPIKFSDNSRNINRIRIPGGIRKHDPIKVSEDSRVLILPGDNFGGDIEGGFGEGGDGFKEINIEGGVIGKEIKDHLSDGAGTRFGIFRFFFNNNFPKTFSMWSHPLSKDKITIMEGSSDDLFKERTLNHEDESDSWSEYFKNIDICDQQFISNVILLVLGILLIISGVKLFVLIATTSYRRNRIYQIDEQNLLYEDEACAKSSKK